MNFGTIRSDEMLGALGTLGVETIAGLLTWEATIGAGRTPVEVLGADAVEGAERVAVNDERLGVVEVMESVGSGDVGTDACSGEDKVAPVLAGPPGLAPAPAQPATMIESTAAPTMERAAYELACPTRTHASERTNAERSTSDMMAW